MRAAMMAIADTTQMRRPAEFASGVTWLADERRDLELRDLIDSLHADSFRFTAEDE